ncbi:hypothetical protein MRS76_21750 [Rhizobiaceae bacterium n13]|uniref:Imelysin-like domain-containing protein n=1 Tax=Ferirhizobium litorale TaxID=2927786 RepID=A0AAE3QGR1_9HYPH|nr:imelysin family protein [Fererhizobium litorale]MDI7864564.1 hypothetical protein [Fererhizobium litorale]MDI7924895.1 hypothetical protein [Fererhizobium litorale]
MRMLHYVIFSLALLPVALPALAQEGNPPPPGTVDEKLVPAIMEKAVDEVIRPGYREFHASAGRLVSAMNALCKTPSADSLVGAKSAFDDTVRSWSHIEIVRIGPVLEGNRLERILFYPDRKSTGLKQVQAVLATRDEQDVSSDGFAERSVAVQGLGALEYVLSGTGAEDLTSEPMSFRCRYGAAVAGNIQNVAGELVAAWDAPDGVQAAWKHPGPDNPEFRDGKEAITALLGILVHGVEMVRDQRIETFYRSGQSNPRPKSAIYWRSGNTWSSIAGNLQGLQTLWKRSDMASLLDPDWRSVAGSVDFVMKSLDRVAPTIDPDIDEAVANEKERGKIDFLLVDTRDLIYRLNDQYGAAIGLGAGFYFSDGD